MCAAYLGAGVLARKAYKKKKDKKSALGMAKDVANEPEVKKGYGGLAGRMIK